MKSYSAVDTNTVADEIQAAPPTAHWPSFITDYATLRAAVRACQKVK